MIIPGRYVSEATKFRSAVPNICGSPVWSLRDVAVVVPVSFGVAGRVLEKLCTA